MYQSSSHPDHMDDDASMDRAGEVCTSVGQHDMWIAPDGTVYYVHPCGHNDVAYILHRTSGYDLEMRGWLHISRFWQGYIVVKDGWTPTGEQRARMWECIRLATQHPEDTQLASIVRMMREYLPLDMDILAEASLSDIWYGIGYYG